MFYHNDAALDVEVTLGCHGSRAAVPEGNGPAPHHNEFGSDEPTMTDIYRLFGKRFDRVKKNLFDKMTSHFDRQEKTLDEFTEAMRGYSGRGYSGI